MAFAGASLIADGKLSDSTMSSFDACGGSGYHLLLVEGYSGAKETISNGEYISSRPFLVGGHRWIIQYYPNGADEGDQEYVSVFLSLDDDVIQDVEAQCEFSFIDQPELQVSTIIPRGEKCVFSDVYHGLNKFMRKDVLERSRHLKNNSFVIRCDVVVIGKSNNTEEQGAKTTASVLVQVPPSDMKSHFSNLLFTKEGADITFEVGCKKFAAHRFVLAARSTVFKAQLFGTMDEVATPPSVLKINDIGAKVFSRLLTFIYTDACVCGVMEEDEAYEDRGYNTEDNGSVEECGEGVMEEDGPYAEEGDNTEDDAAAEEKGAGFLLNLLEAAARYDLQKLKSICEDILASRHICATNVANIIVVAERRGCRFLKEACLEFIKSHTSVHKFFTPSCLDEIIRTTTSSRLKELLSKFPVS